jgi:hypothetical protein
MPAHRGAIRSNFRTIPCRDNLGKVVFLETAGVNKSFTERRRLMARKPLDVTEIEKEIPEDRFYHFVRR